MKSHPYFPGVYFNAQGSFDSFFFEKVSRKKIIACTNEEIPEIAAFELSLKLEEHTKLYPECVTTYKLKKLEKPTKTRKTKKQHYE